jgi:hypothetical protein
MDINSNCTRVDAVKAMYNQLQMRLNTTPHTTPEDPAYRKAQAQLQALDTVVRAGNAPQAETALTTASTAVQQLQIQTPAASGPHGGLDVFA